MSLKKGISVTLIIVACILILFTFINQIDNGNVFEDFDELEEEYGVLEPYTPKATFVHFKTKNGYQIDCIKRENGRYTFLSKSKIKE